MENEPRGARGAYAAAALVLIARARSRRPRPPPVRSAEKDRKSTCAFADRVAQCAIEAFDRLCAAAGIEYRQTVCAAIVAVDRRAGGATFSVVALGVGTKFLRAAQISADGGAGRVVRDCHAEVLARRAFKRFLCAELRRCVERGGGGLLRPPSDSGGRFGVADGVTFHLYSSSQPCGNASVRRWAKSGAGAVHAELADTELPPAPHAWAGAPHARKQGMLALSVKREPRDGGADDGGAEDGGGDDAVVCASGTSALASGEGVVLSCSDKIARWNALGRRARCSRTFCRRSTWRRSPSAAALRAHASVRSAAAAGLCAGDDRRDAARLRRAPPADARHRAQARPRRDQHGGRRGIPADFSEARCLCWAAGDAAPEVLDGATGEVAGGAASRVQRRLRADFRALCAAARSARLAPASLPPEAEDATTKRDLEDAEYRRARELLHSRGCFRRVGAAYVYVRRGKSKVDTL